MSKQVLSIEQMQHLEELGVDTSKANFYWHRTKSLNNYNDWDEWKLHYGVLRLARGFTTINCQYVRTFTLQDILDLIPQDITPLSLPYSLFIDYQEMRIAYCSVDREGMVFVEPTFNIGEELIDAAYEMLCWVIENRYVDTKK
mgnify:CR=1 FL=1